MDLARELRMLIRALSEKEPEVVSFHGTRLLEYIARCACTSAFGSAATNLYSNIESLRSIGMISHEDALSMHALRRIGNESRHAVRTLSDMDAALAATWSLDAMRWSIGLGAEPCLRLGIAPGLVLQFDALESALAGVFDPEMLDPGSIQGLRFSLDYFRDHPAALARVLEGAIDRFPPAEVAGYVRECAEKHPGAARFRQLHAVVLSRLGKLVEAEREISACSRDGDDVEGLGILGGILKRRWEATGDDSALDGALDAYRLGWQISARSNAYVGVNLAALLLWRGLRKAAMDVARDVLSVLDRFHLVAGKSRDGWDLLTRVECLVLLGDIDQATQLRNSSQVRGACTDSMLDVADRQAARHLLIVSPEAPEWPQG